MHDIDENDEEYVCITHQCVSPCPDGDFHLISNWISDVYTIKKIMRKNENI